MKVLCAGLLVLLLVGCLTAPPVQQETKIVDASYDILFEAVKATYVELGCDITAGSKESGFLNGKMRMPESMGYMLLTGETQKKDLMYSTTIVGSQVTVKIYEKSHAYGWENPASQDAYTMFWNAFLVNVERG